MRKIQMFARFLIDLIVCCLCWVVGTLATGNVWAGLGLAAIVASYGIFNFQQGASAIARKP